MSDGRTRSRQITRYRNRSLYDRDDARFTSIAELAEILRRGIRVKVVDHDTGDDVTGAVLAQVLRLDSNSRRNRRRNELLFKLLHEPDQLAATVKHNEERLRDLLELRKRMEDLSESLLEIIDAEDDQDEDLQGDAS